MTSIWFFICLVKIKASTQSYFASNSDLNDEIDDPDSYTSQPTSLTFKSSNDHNINSKLSNKHSNRNKSTPSSTTTTTTSLTTNAKSTSPSPSTSSSSSSLSSSYKSTTTSNSVNSNSNSGGYSQSKQDNVISPPVSPTISNNNGKSSVLEEPTIKFRCIFGSFAICPNRFKEEHLREYSHDDEPSSNIDDTSSFDLSEKSSPKSFSVSSLSSSGRSPATSTTTTATITSDSFDISSSDKVKKRLLNESGGGSGHSQASPHSQHQKIVSPAASQSSSSQSTIPDLDDTVIKKLPEFKKRKKLHEKNTPIIKDEIEDIVNTSTTTTTTTTTKTKSTNSNSINNSNFNNNNNNNNNSNNYKKPLSSNNNNDNSLKNTKIFEDLDIFNEEPLEESVHVASKAKITKKNTSEPSIFKRNSKDSRAWTEKYEPKTEDDIRLTIHRKKVDEVKQWFQDRSNEISNGTLITQKMLIMTGPAGVGKTALTRVFANQFGFNLEEWTNPVMDIVKDKDDKVVSYYKPQLEIFKSWLKSNERCDLFGNVLGKKKLLIIEETPNVQSPGILAEFREGMKQFLRRTIFPLIFIYSDSSVANTNLSKIFDYQLQNNSLTQHISFNPIAPVTLFKYLKDISITEGFNIEDDQIESIRLESGGDIRASINSLEFHCIGKVRQVIVKPKKSKRATNTTKTTTSTPKNRDQSISLFHSLGKVLYNKRIPDTLPKDEWYRDEYLREKMESNPEQSFENSHVDGNMFTMFLQENFLSFYSDIEEISDTLGYLSDSDTIASAKSNVDSINPHSMSISLRGFMYCHTKQASFRFFHFVKPHFQQSYDQSQAIQDSIKGFIYNQQVPSAVSSSLSPITNQPRNNLSSFQTTLSLYEHSTLLRHTLPFLSYMSRQRGIMPYLNDVNNPYSAFLKGEGRLILDRLCLINPKIYGSYASQKDYQIGEKSTFATENDTDEVQNNQNNQSNGQRNNFNNNSNFGNNNNNNIGDSGGDDPQKSTRILYGNNEVLEEDDIIE
ncbi:hypothetical protein PPL_06202 [Heterostelium album PN500]|uniref:Checkpoint protein RAD24-like helical bundle domain-containing protein n=1 Tax=Heterostelium pallidum (strain ATCC 26659 / Pp 5 / PN500) TaxID=670386 RepID=D3BCH7_HETP5|nr:hypothetical protein PPL_06202 [Heterostelium album PN500]EFA80967.1 hypothetical protein PPL_06202 [Heterostelium album PN500]|eukprot:XP_020433085.1 hypothetical protein PPL_06202 [Heterostelium album PN500]